MRSLDVPIRDVDQKCATFHLKVAHALSTINTDNLLFLTGPKSFMTNCISATPIPLYTDGGNRYGRYMEL